jgi:integrase
VTLADGERRQGAMAFACEAMGNPLATEFNAKIFAAYREKRLSGKLTRSSRVKTVAPRTVNLELAYFKAMFNELRRLDEWTSPNPLENVREFKIGESEMAYLTYDEIRTLLAECDKSRAKDLTTIVKICLATGARWSEAEGLRGNQVRAGQIIYVKTKGKKNRAVPVSESLQAGLPSSREAQPLFTPLLFCIQESTATRGNRNSPRPTYPRSAPYVCFSFHDERRKYPCTSTNFGAYRYQGNHALCSFCTGSFIRGNVT